MSAPSAIPREVAIRRMIAESDKFMAEQRKAIAEGEKFSAEQRKLWAEGQWRRLPPWLAVAGPTGGVVTAASVILRALKINC